MDECLSQKQRRPAVSAEEEIDVGNNYACCDSLSGGKWATPSVKAACNKYTAPFGGEPTDAFGLRVEDEDLCPRYDLRRVSGMAPGREAHDLRRTPRRRRATRD